MGATPGTAWVNKVDHVTDGEPVNASVTGRPTRELEKQDRYLKEQLEALQTAGGLYVFGASLTAAVQQGAPVYWDPALQAFAPAVWKVQVDEATGLQTPAPCSLVIGIVAAKTNPTLGDILILGWACVVPAVEPGQTLSPGLYYLSSRTPGTVTLQPPVGGAPVLFADGFGKIYVLPQYPDLLRGHAHYRISLFSSVAGDTSPPAVGAEHVITNANPALPGWLPAADPSFLGLAPAGAVFGYNLAAHPDLQQLWPPVPITAVSLLLFTGLQGYGVEVPLGPEGLAIVDTNGIWWRSSCFGSVPWETYLDTSGSLSADLNPLLSSLSSSSGEGGICPRPQPSRYVDVCLTRARVALNPDSVTSLTGVSPLVVTHCDGTPGSVGDLKVSLAGGFLQVDNAPVGYMVMKDLVGGNQFQRGPVVEGVIAGNDSVTITGTAQRFLTPGDSTTPVLSQGVVTVVANLEPAVRAISPQIVRLDDVRERLYSGITYLGFPAGIDSSVLLKYRMPTSANFPANPRIRLSVSLMALANGTIPNLLLFTQVVPSADSGPVTLVAGTTSLGLTTTATLTANQIEQFISAPLAPVAPDSLIFVTLERPLGDSYGAEVGLVDVVALLDDAS